MTTKQEMISFLNEVRQRLEEFCLSYNAFGVIDKRTWDTPMGPLDVVISKGKVFDKASMIYCDLTIETPPVLAEQLGQKGRTAEALVLEMNLFPVNPCVPKGYLELRANITDKVAFAGGTDIFMYFQRREDVDFFADGMKKLCSRHGQNYNVLQQTRMDFFKSKYRKENVGSHAGIYSFNIAEKDFAFFKDMADAFFTLYTELVDRRNPEEFTANDIEHKNKIHGLWVEWILLEDTGTKYGLDQGIPPDALLGAILPPKAVF
jgi:coproporphyrinogen III oxidase